MSIDYKQITGLELQDTCVGIPANKWDRLMKGHVRANKREINRLVKLYLPILYHDLSLDCYNPYNYHRTKTHLILVHSSIEYFISFNTKNS